MIFDKRPLHRGLHSTSTGWKEANLQARRTRQSSLPSGGAVPGSPQAWRQGQILSPSPRLLAQGAALGMSPSSQCPSGPDFLDHPENQLAPSRGDSLQVRGA